MLFNHHVIDKQILYINVHPCCESVLLGSDLPLPPPRASADTDNSNPSPR